jgi:hypothetical protein
MTCPEIQSCDIKEKLYLGKAITEKIIQEVINAS